MVKKRRTEDQADLDDAKKALADSSKNGTVSWESLKKKLKVYRRKTQGDLNKLNDGNDLTI